MNHGTAAVEEMLDRGVQTFEKVIEGNYLYIDKTEYIYRMAHGASNYYFLSRSCRFGKSLLISTLDIPNSEIYGWG